MLAASQVECLKKGLEAEPQHQKVAPWVAAKMALLLRANAHVVSLAADYYEASTHPRLPCEAASSTRFFCHGTDKRHFQIEVRAGAYHENNKKVRLIQSPSICPTSSLAVTFPSKHVLTFHSFINPFPHSHRAPTFQVILLQLYPPHYPPNQCSPSTNPQGHHTLPPILPRHSRDLGSHGVDRRSTSATRSDG